MEVVSRKEWGARPPLGRPPIRARDVRGVCVHYTGMDSDEQADHRNCAERIRAIQRYHMDRNGWFDIAYNHVFCRHGYVFEGRGFGVRSGANGTRDANDRYFAVAFLGNDSSGRKDVTDAARRALAQLVLAYRRRYRRAREVRPHSDFARTACPGEELRRIIATGSWVQLAGKPWPHLAGLVSRIRSLVP